MTPIQTPACNAVLRRPMGTTAAECSDLWIQRGQTADGRDCVISFWQMSPEELAAANRGEPVRFMVWGNTHPPVSLWCEHEGQDLRPGEVLASKLIDAWITHNKQPIPWAKAVYITAQCCKLSEAERAALLALK